MLLSGISAATGLQIQFLPWYHVTIMAADWPFGKTNDIKQYIKETRLNIPILAQDALLKELDQLLNAAHVPEKREQKKNGKKCAHAHVSDSVNFSSQRVCKQYLKNLWCDDILWIDFHFNVGK